VGIDDGDTSGECEGAADALAVGFEDGERVGEPVGSEDRALDGKGEGATE